MVVDIAVATTYTDYMPTRRHYLEDVLVYEFSWKTCRNHPVLRGEVLETLQTVMPQIVEAANLTLDKFRIRNRGREVFVRISTTDKSRSVRSIAYLLRKASSGKLRKKYKELHKLPSLWTSEYRSATVGKGVAYVE